jgi:hypothetical protein
MKGDNIPIIRILIHSHLGLGLASKMIKRAMKKVTKSQKYGAAVTNQVG